MGAPRRKKLQGPWATRYEISKPLGQGGAGEVFLAKDLRRGGLGVALKILDKRRLRDPSLADSLRNEFSSLTRLRHPHLARVWDFGASTQEMFLSTEFIDGPDLLSACRDADLNTVFRRIVELLRGLDYLHRRGVLHLDLKPENILVASPKQGAGGVKLIDFGLAKWNLKNAETETEFSGSPPYSAPELLLGESPSPASDLYALGMIFYQLFSSGLPFASEDPLQRMQAQLYGNLPAPQELNPALPEAFGGLMHALVDRYPTRRPASPEALLREINTLLGEKYSLRPPVAPVQILEESDRLFFPEILAELLASTKAPDKFLVVAEPGGGKSRLLRHFKERLQLTGRQPLFFSDLKSFQETSPAKNGNTEAILLDLKDLTLESLNEIGGSSGNAPTYISSNLAFEGATEFQLLRVPRLDGARARVWLSEEIQNFPEILSESLAHQAGGNLNLLEELLQELRERHALYWGEDGWHWNTLQEERSHSDLQESFQQRWEARWNRVSALLAYFSKGLNAPSLAGMLGLDTGNLLPKLAGWEADGRLSSAGSGPLRLYFVQDTSTASKNTPSEENKNLGETLRSLYEKGEFESGCRIALALTKNDPPEEWKLFGARHLTAAGQSKAALSFLPPSPPSSPALRGLYQEIRARALASLGELEDATHALELGEAAYQEARDFSGLSRLSNQRGWFEKKRGNLEAALQGYKHSVALAASAHDDYAQGLALLNIGGIHLDRGELENALAHYSQVEALAERTAHPLLRLKLANNLTNLYFTMGRASDAERSCLEMLKWSIESSFPEEQAAALNFLSLLAGQRGEEENQKLYLDQAIALAESRPGSGLKPQLFFNRGHLHWDQGRSTAAQLDAEAALQAAKESSNAFIEAWSLLLKAKVLRDRLKPDFDEAKELAEQAATQLRRLQLGNLIWEAEFDLGLLAKRRQEPEAARRHLLSAREQLQALLQEIPEARRSSYLRDRKLEKIEEELKSIL